MLASRKNLQPRRANKRNGLDMSLLFHLFIQFKVAFFARFFEYYLLFYLGFFWNRSEICYDVFFRSYA